MPLNEIWSLWKKKCRFYDLKITGLQTMIRGSKVAHLLTWICNEKLIFTRTTRSLSCLHFLKMHRIFLQVYLGQKTIYLMEKNISYINQGIHWYPCHPTFLWKINFRLVWRLISAFIWDISGLGNPSDGRDFRDIRIDMYRFLTPYYVFTNYF